MFYSLAIVLCLAVLFIVVAGSSLLSALALSLARRLLRFLPPKARANLVFLMRALPFFLAGLITLGFALPAFLRFEPRSSDEIVGPRLVALAALGLLVVAALTIRSWRILRTTHHAQKQWRNHSHRLQIDGVKVAIYSSDHPSPLLAVAGIFRPEIFVAESVMNKLSSGELFAAIAHEMAHVSALDNLKQFILKATRMPKWLNLSSSGDAMWLNASEIAADEGAVAGGASALDLSSALVKVAGLSRQLPAAPMIAASHLLPVASESCIETRVNHLRKLLENDDHEQVRTGAGRNYWPAFSLLILAVGYVACVNAVLPWMHEVLEMLVR